MKDLLIGIDAGTSVMKAVAFTLDGVQCAEQSIPNSYHSVEGGGVEQDPLLTWQHTADVLRGLSQAIPDLPARVAALSVTGQGDGTWLIDKHGTPATPLRGNRHRLRRLPAKRAAVVDAAKPTRTDQRGRNRFSLQGLALYETDG